MPDYMPNVNSEKLGPNYTSARISNMGVLIRMIPFMLEFSLKLFIGWVSLQVVSPAETNLATWINLTVENATYNHRILVNMELELLPTLYLSI